MPPEDTGKPAATETAVPATETASAGAAVETGAAETPAAPAAETPAAEAPGEAAAAPAAAEAPAAATETADPGLLAATEKQPAAATAADDKAGETAAVPETPAEAPRYDAFTLPDGVELDGDGLGRFTEFATANGFTQEVAQGLVDLHVADMQRYADHLRQEQHRIFAETRAGWRKEIMADPDYGGAQLATNRAAAVRTLDLFVPPDERAAFNQALIVTGMTDHPQFFRFLSRLAQKFDEPAPKPPGNPAPRPQGRAPNRRAGLYTNPSSPR